MSDDRESDEYDQHQMYVATGLATSTVILFISIAYELWIFTGIGAIIFILTMMSIHSGLKRFHDGT